ncbi:MAG TPA: helix-turn-helix domain-containing protein [Candidatus Competibacteraceae bacterium]|nr:helix-turn-helix domain-containing protein [Candidatus Competibacteraceae bacterium]HRZ08180.1 helix-turn-helix domain-containing protein [Candidatus Competibacteraceae bacterium]HSA48264.1 helix-turn-helix domain-containing protein [Candidatus Competibacteraceae bacterium]
MADNYLVDLTEEEQGYRLDVIHKGKMAARRVARAHVLLRAAEGTTDEDIAKALHLAMASVHRIRQRLVDEGLTAAFSERPRSGSRKSLRMPRRLRRGGMSNLGSRFDACYPDRSLFLVF